MGINEFICPECKGQGINNEDGSDCWYCDGLGFASDEDPKESIYRYDQEW